MYEALFDRFTIELTAEQARYGSPPGQNASPFIRELLREPEIARQIEAIPAADIRAELAGHGAWVEPGELDDDDLNRERILWLACGDVREEHRL